MQPSVQDLTSAITRVVRATRNPDVLMICEELQRRIRVDAVNAVNASTVNAVNKPAESVNAVNAPKQTARSDMAAYMRDYRLRRKNSGQRATG